MQYLLSFKYQYVYLRFANCIITSESILLTTFQTYYGERRRDLQNVFEDVRVAFVHYGQ